MYTSPEDQDRNETGVGDGAGGRALPPARLAHDQILRVFGDKAAALVSTTPAAGSLAAQIARLELAQDLGRDIGSRGWFRGLGTFVGLTAAALAFWPSYAPLEAAPPASIEAENVDEYRSQLIMPLALGSDTGRRMGATALVRPLAAAPERPQLQLVATLARGDSFDRMLAARRGRPPRIGPRGLAALVGDAHGAGRRSRRARKVDISLGRRDRAGGARPLESLAFRARFDLALEIGRLEEGGHYRSPASRSAWTTRRCAFAARSAPAFIAPPAPPERRLRRSRPISRRSTPNPKSAGICVPATPST